MDGNVLPGYIRRAEEAQILEKSASVRQDGTSRVVLLYGPGGVGKTQLVRYLREARRFDSEEVWVDPIDIDDPQFWLLSNLERHVADWVDPGKEYFGRYLEYLSRLPSITRPYIGHETVVSHLGRIKRVFAECYQDFISNSGKTVVVVLDTIEAIRGMDLLQTLTQWIKSLPGTLFILCGRPVPAVGRTEDPIKNELLDPHQKMDVTIVELGDFSEANATSYLEDTRTLVHLEEAERTRLVHLTRGHPLLLALTVSYLREVGLPPEAEAGPPEQVAESLAHLREIMPFGQQLLREGLNLHDAFKTSLVAPFQGSDFWHEAVKRLAVVRESVDQKIWAQLMSDLPLPPDVAGPAEAWQQLQDNEWIRPRANSRYVTLHDALAEELAERLIPAHDADKQWRRRLWRRAADIYAGLTEGSEAELTSELSSLDEDLQAWYMNPAPVGDETRPLLRERQLIQVTAALDARKRALAQARAIRLYYEILCDFDAGTRMFLRIFQQARDDHDVVFQELLAFEMQRFLPGGADAFNDVIKEEVERFRGWLLSAEGRARHLEIALSMADYLIRTEMPGRALVLLDARLDAVAGPDARYRLSNLRGNACMRIPGQVSRGLEYFEQALADARHARSPSRHKQIAAAYKELGFFYRNEGRWDRADDSYKQARKAISAGLSAASPDQDREEMASIQTNWAYVKGLTGSYRDGSNLVESAITVRRRLKNRHEEGISLSVSGEVYRYERRFQSAWTAYAEAEQIFHDLRNWAWLGLIYQEQAICLYQASREGTTLIPGKDPLEQAKRLITVALDLCRDLAIRSYPSALNRAGRIFSMEEPGRALEFLAEGIGQARRLSDGWFWFANLIEYAELCFQLWMKTDDQAFRYRIEERADEIATVGAEYKFPDLEGRWRLLQGHLRVRDSLSSGDESLLRAAREDFKQGFILIAQRYVGSSGRSAVPREFRKLAELIWGLPQYIRSEWQAEFQRAWSQEEYGATLLLARLEELY